MKKRNIILLIIVLLIGALAYYYYSKNRGQLEEEDMKFQEASWEDSSSKQLITAKVQSKAQEAHYNDPQKGTIAELYVREGEDVEIGTPLFKYDGKNAEAQVNKASLQAEDLSIQIKGMETRISNLERSIKNSQVEEEKNSLKDQKEELSSQLKSLKKQKESAEIDISLAKDQVEDLTIRSKSKGRVSEIDEDQLAGSNSLEQKPAIKIISREPVISGKLTEVQRTLIKKGQKLSATAKAYKGETWQGEVTYVSDYPEEVSPMEGEGSESSYPFEAVLNDWKDLVPGNTLYLEMEIEGDRELRIPSTAVKHEEDSLGNQTYYCLIDEGGILKKVEIKIGLEEGGKTPVLDGLKGGERVLINPGETREEGDPVDSEGEKLPKSESQGEKEGDIKLEEGANQ